MKNDIPLSLYVHVPFCARKCPYCDFYSNATKNISEEKFLADLIAQLNGLKHYAQNRSLISIYIGGGTPSLLSANTIKSLITAIQKLISFEKNIEISMEINPGTIDFKKLIALRNAGINRLSIGIQSFQNEKLNLLGRIHDANTAREAFDMARQTEFDNINIDLMHGLPQQTVNDAVYDLKQAIELNPEHLSWYQLTIEPDTPFGKNSPILPDEETLASIQQTGHALLLEHHFQHYEISAYAKSEKQCQHNLNYWTFGDYLGIGKGAHGKITQDKNIIRLADKEYIVPPEDLPSEFMLNALRLTDGVPLKLFEERTFLSIETIHKPLEIAKKRDLIRIENNKIKTTQLGQRFLNDCLELFV